MMACFIGVKCPVSGIPYESEQFYKDASGVPFYCRKTSGDLTKAFNIFYALDQKLFDPAQWVIFSSAAAGALFEKDMQQC